jgi:hypothetical protein
MPYASSLRSTIGLLSATTLGLALGLGFAEPARASGPLAPASPSAASLQKLVNSMRKELGVTHRVVVDVVAENPLKASVEPVHGTPEKYRLSIERRFLDQLSEAELRAVVAHELGHVWIYTHHPYLQTEQGANTIALKVASRETLLKVYGKVWADAGAAGSLARLPDPEPATTAAGLGSPRR